MGWHLEGDAGAQCESHDCDGTTNERCYVRQGGGIFTCGAATLRPHNPPATQGKKSPRGIQHAAGGILFHVKFQLRIVTCFTSVETSRDLRVLKHQRTPVCLN